MLYESLLTLLLHSWEIKCRKSTCTVQLCNRLHYFYENEVLKLVGPSAFSIPVVTSRILLVFETSPAFLSVILGMILLIFLMFFIGLSDGFFSPKSAIPSRVGVLHGPRYVRASPVKVLMTSTSMPVTKPPLVEPFGRALLKDIKRKLPVYKSEIVDGFTLKSLSATMFLFFACLAPAVAFGGLLASVTGGAMGTMETVGATALGGLLYAGFSAQPLTIIGTTGPLLAFVKVVHSTCVRSGLPFLPIYSWIGLWSALFLMLSSFFSTSNVVEYFTQFTDDIFSSLISVIFIFEACSTMIGGFRNPLMSGTVACGSLIVAMMTYFTTMKLKTLRKTSLLPRQLRNLVSDFAPTIGVGTGIATAKAIVGRYGTVLPALSIPDIVGTTSGRPWLVPLMDVSPKLRLLCAIPAIMATILLFMDQNITVRLVMSKQNKLKKGSGLHLDMFVVSLITALTSVLGMPWMVAATVRSLAHVRSLQEYGEVTSIDSTGLSQTKSEVTGVQEQRVSGLAIHAIIGAAVLSTAGRSFLRGVPTSVLTGLFLYLGMSSINTTELYDRFIVLLSDPKDVTESTPGIKSAGLKKTNLFTSIQLILLASMFWVKNTALGVFFPVLVGLLPPVRIALEKFGFFSKPELDGLDGELD